MMREIFSSKGLKYDILKYVNEFPTCQKNKLEHTHPVGLLHSLLIPEQKWESISMDFIIGFPKVFGKDCIFVVVDRITKFSHLFVVTTTFTIVQVVELFFKEVFRLHGILKSIVSDRHSRFFSAFWK